jgi:AcrR family transcriptional regulator
MPARKKFTDDQLRAAALAIVDTEGLLALTMRRLAEALGTGAMTLYNYVEDRDGLEALIVGAVMSEARLPPMSGRSADDVRAIATVLWRTVRRHPNVIPLILNRRTDDWATLEMVEALLEAIARSGRSGFDLLAAFRTVSGFVAGFAQSEVAGLLTKTATGSAKELRARIQAASGGRLKRLAEIAAVGIPGDPEREFQAGLDIVLAGLAATSARPRRAALGRRKA